MINYHLLKGALLPLFIICLLSIACDADFLVEDTDNRQTTTVNNTTNDPIPEEPSRELADDFDEKDLRFENQQISLTYHARCRMDCRHIDAYEIQEVINQNHINSRKSKSTAPPGKCPTTAYEGMTRDNQKIRVILGTCKNDPKIITVIDLKNDYKCSCK